jgi:hypothetical protein
MPKIQNIHARLAQPNEEIMRLHKDLACLHHILRSIIIGTLVNADPARDIFVAKQG